jgi:pilus assembly protein CpaB
MNFRRMAIAMAIGLIVSGTCTWFLSRKISAHGPERPPEQKYVAPARALKAGEVVKADSVELIPWPVGVPIANAFSKPEAVIGRTVLYPIAKDQPITEQFLTAIGSGAGLAGKIPDGMRAVALRSDEVVGVAGFLLPDSHVDVLATIHTDKSPEPTTFTVLQNVQVLAAGHQIEPDPEGKPASVTVVTLLLSPAETERAVLASLQGTIHFVLRSGSDRDMSTAAPLDLAQLVGGPAKPAAPRTGRAPTSKPDITAPLRKVPMDVAVETIAGEKQTTDTFRVNQQ